MKLTVFTPTYNRADYLGRIYNSLLEQTNKEFIWLIVDDGSTDNTQNIVEEMQHNAPFSIQYVYQENQGKHIAMNTGIMKTKTPYFFAIDSDDWLMTDAIEKIIVNIEKNHSNQRAIGYVFQCFDEYDKLITSAAFPSCPWYGGFDQLNHKEKIIGDTAIVYDTNIAKKHLYPQFPDEKFVPEALVLNRLNYYEGNFCFLNIPIKYVEYLEDGFSANMQVLFKNNPQGYFLYALELLNFFPHDMKQTIRHIAAVGVFGKKIGKKPKEILSLLKKTMHRLLYILMLPAIYLYKL